MVSLEFLIDVILLVALWPRRSTRTLTEMSTRSISLRGDKGGQCVRLTILPPSCLEIWDPQTAGTLRVCKGISLPLYFSRICEVIFIVEE